KPRPNAGFASHVSSATDRHQIRRKRLLSHLYALGSAWWLTSATGFTIERKCASTVPILSCAQPLLVTVATAKTRAAATNHAVTCATGYAHRRASASSAITTNAPTIDARLSFVMTSRNSTVAYGHAQ